MINKMNCKNLRTMLMFSVQRNKWNRKEKLKENRRMQGKMKKKLF